jgi:hypothetical protein
MIKPGRGRGVVMLVELVKKEAWLRREVWERRRPLRAH